MIILRNQEPILTDKKVEKKSDENEKQDFKNKGCIRSQR